MLSKSKFDPKAFYCIVIFIISCWLLAYTFHQRGIGGFKNDILDKRWYYNSIVFDFGDEYNSFSQKIEHGTRLRGEVILHPNQQLTNTNNLQAIPPLTSKKIMVDLVSRSSWELSGQHLLTKIENIVIRPRGANQIAMSPSDREHIHLLHSFSMGMTREIVSVSDNFLLMSGGQGLTVLYADQ